MKFTLSWLKDHLQTDADLTSLTDTLTAIGLELEQVTDRAKALSDFTVARVSDARQHPDADRLRVCTVETGSETLQIICGAPNARAGINVALAPVGAIIPATGDRLKKGLIRGVESQGMMCSAYELNLGTDHDGIIELPEGAEIGAPVADVLGLTDPVIEINLTPNRPDCTGVRGIARDLAATGLGTLKPLPRSEPVTGTFDSPIRVSIADDVTADGTCPAFYGRYIKGVKNGESPDWLKRKLEAVGLRPISALVDITNLVSVDLGRPLHVFDADKLTGDLSVRYGRDGETLRALNDSDYALTGSMVAICDAAGPQGLGGVIGGQSTGCNEDTVNVFLECALFDAVNIARTGRALNVITDARYRFERGVDPASVDWGLEVATRLITELCGGDASNPVKTGTVPGATSPHILRLDRIRALGGIEVSDARATGILANLGFVLAQTDTARVFNVTAPGWRPDITGEADLVEEVLRIIGYDTIPTIALPRQSALPKPALSARQKRVGVIRRSLAARGLNETVTWAFTDSRYAGLFAEPDPGLFLVNPISSDLDVMRPSGLINLLLAVTSNQHRGGDDVALFEIGPEFHGTLPGDQRLAACGVRAGQAVPRNWSGGARDVDAFDVKADLMSALHAVGQNTGAVQIAQGQAPGWYHPGRSAVMQLGPKNRLAAFGEVHPKILNAMDVTGRVAAFELFPQAIPLPKRKGTARPLLKSSPYQPVERDFAFLINADMAAEKLVRAAKSADKALIGDVSVFDVYTGPGIDPGKKSVAFAVTLQPVKQTFTDEDIENLSEKIIAAVTKTTGGTLRGV